MQKKHTSRYHISQNPKLASFIIRLGLATVFAYAAIDAFIVPDAWILFVPSMATRFVSAKTALDAISVLQLVLVAWLIWGKYIKYAATLAIVFLAGVMLANLSTFLITFRDIGLIAAAIAVILLDE